MADPEIKLPETIVFVPPHTAFLITRAANISPGITAVSYRASETFRGDGALGLSATYQGEAIVGPNGAMVLFGSQWPSSMDRDAAESEVRRAEHKRRKELADG